MRFMDALRKGRLLRGMLLTTASAEIAEAVSHAGLDWAFIDLEHSAMGFLEAQNVVRALGGRTASALRLPDQSAISIHKALDIGCDAIIVPQVNTREEAAAIVKAARYIPKGRFAALHGHPYARAHKYGVSFRSYAKSAQNSTALIVQIEDKKAVANLSGILAVEGVDGIFIGPYDLSSSMGLRGQLDHPKVTAAIDAVFAGAKRARMPVGTFSPTVEGAKMAVERGARLLAVGVDTIYLAEAVREIGRIGRRK